MDQKYSNQLGYLVLKDDGAVLESAGELKNDERCGNIILDLLHLTESVDENFMPISSCERISIVFDDHTYNICMSNRRIYVMKLRTGNGVSTSSGASSTSNNGSGILYTDPGENGGSTTIMA